MEKLKPKNKEQEEAIKIGIDFLNNGDPSEWLIIGGKAGTGKTTIAQAIIQDYVKTRNILVCALSHKAKLVITEKLRKAFGKSSIVSKSIAGALGMHMDPETGRFILDKNADMEPAIKAADIIIIDEGSMVNEESHHLIMTEKKRNAKVIYLGDIRQLPPIRESHSPDAGKPSPVFYGKHRAILKERIRQGEESPILPFADFFGDNSRLKVPFENPAPKIARKNYVGEFGALVSADNTDDVIRSVLPLYKYSVDTHDVNIIKTVSYRNATRQRINHMVRQYIFGKDEAGDQFVTGDLIMFSDNFQIPEFIEPISNSYEVQLTGAVEIQDRAYQVWELSFIYESKPVIVKALADSEKPRHAADVTRKFEYAKSLPFGTTERSDALAEAWGLKNRYAPVEYAYAITSHKCQGSTYNTVVVDERDIMSVKMINNKEKSQSMYTALTRASKTCIVIDGIQTDESLLKAVELSMAAIAQFS